MVFDGREIIGKLRVKGPTQDSPALRLRLSSFLGNASLRPPGMPPSAVLVVKKVTQLWPQGLAWEDSRLLPPPAWNKTLQSSMAEAWTTAARPTLGRVPMDVESVCFSDESEMLACLSLDLISGAVPGNWIWVQVFRSLPSPARTRMAALWSARVGHLPALFSHLYGWKKLESALTTLARSEALDLVSEMARHHGLSFNPKREESDLVFSTGAGADFSDPNDTERVSPGDSSFQAASPWQSLPPGFASETGRLPYHTLLGRLGWMIQNRPGQARSRTFSQAVSDWWRIRSDRQMGPEPIVGEIRTRTREAFSFLETDRESKPESGDSQGNIDATHGLPAFPGRAPEKMSDPFPSVLEDGKITAARIPSPLQNEIQRREPEGARVKDRAGSTMENDNGTASDLNNVSSLAAFPISPQPVSESIGDSPSESPQGHAPLAPPIDDGSQSDPRVVPEESDFPNQDFQESQAPGLSEGVHTRMAGVFYLVNLLMEWQWLERLRAAGLGEGLSAWDWIELWARALLDDTAAADPDDPIWSVLAALAGRETGILPCIVDSPKALLPSPNPMHAPFILDTVPPSRISPQSSSETSIEFHPGPLTAGLTEATRGHLEKILPHLRMGVTAILHAGAPLLIGEDGNLDITVTYMLLQSGLLHVNATHVDVMMRLADIIMPLRRTGLDRNPGWAADFGRVIYFHFD